MLLLNVLLAEYGLDALHFLIALRIVLVLLVIYVKEPRILGHPEYIFVAAVIVRVIRMDNKRWQEVAQPNVVRSFKVYG